MFISVAYDNKAVDALLDRSQVSDSHTDDVKAVGVNEYLRSFKVASYKVKETDDPDAEEVSVIFYALHYRRAK